MDEMLTMTDTIKGHCLETVTPDDDDFLTGYLGGQALVADFAARVQALKEDAQFSKIYFDNSLQSRLDEIAGHLAAVVESESLQLAAISGRIPAHRFAAMARQMETLKDITCPSSLNC